MDVDDDLNSINTPGELIRPALATPSAGRSPLERPAGATQTPLTRPPGATQTPPATLPPQETPPPRNARQQQSGDNPPQNNPDGEDGARSTFVHLFRAWRNERMAPEILPYQQDLIDDQLEVCTYQQRNLDEIPTWERGEDDVEGDEPFVTANANEHFMQIDLARVQWLLRSYLRLRVRKLESFSHYYFENPEFLSQQERKLVKDLAEIEKQQYEQMCIKQVDQRLRKTLMTSDMMPKPDFSNYVFCEVIEDNTTVLFTNTQATPTATNKQQKRKSSVGVSQESVVHGKGDRFFTLYAHVRPLLVTDKQRLCLF